LTVVAKLKYNKSFLGMQPACFRIADEKLSSDKIKRILRRFFNPAKSAAAFYNK
jgi:hypothetical protein